jgi:hypothetical protein
VRGDYDRLLQWLRGREAAVRSVSVTFDELERVLEASLPHSARAHRGWWANSISGRHAWATAWLQAGWRVAHVDRGGGWVRFERIA